MDLRNQRPSDNFKDRTGWDDGRRKRHTIATLMNPALAAAKVHDWLQMKGVAPVRREVDFRKAGITGILDKK